MNKKIKKIIAKKNKSKILSLTAYSKNIAQIIDKYVDMTLVGDSMASVLYNYNTTRKITLDTMIEHAKSVSMGINNSLMVFDMPYNTYRNKKIALINAQKVIKKTKSDAVKLEGGSEVEDSIKRIIESGVPVMGHLGLTPQSIYKFGTYTVRAKQSEEIKKLKNDIKKLEKAGCFAVVLEKIPAKLAKELTESVKIPIIGIGAGSDVDGQVLVMHDMLGMNMKFNPRFLRRYSNLSEIIDEAVKKYIVDVKNNSFPNKDEEYN